jgi:hypothetical protein
MSAARAFLPPKCRAPTHCDRDWSTRPVQNGATAPDANVQVGDCVDDARQQWRPVGTPSGTYAWVNLISSQVLEVASGAANVVQGTYAVGAERQLWSVTEA